MCHSREVHFGSCPRCVGLVGFERVVLGGVEYEGDVYLEHGPDDWVVNLDELHVHAANACAGGSEPSREVGIAAQLRASALDIHPSHRGLTLGYEIREGSAEVSAFVARVLLQPGA